MKTVAVILAAGVGARMHAPVTKQRMKIAGQSVLFRAISPFLTQEDVERIVLVIREEEHAFVDQTVQQIGATGKPLLTVVGGNTRAASARIGVRAAGECDFVAIHDAARCLLTSDQLRLVLDTAYCAGAATASSAVTDTVKETDETGHILRTVPRSRLRLMQTPQVFRREDYLRAMTAWEESVARGEAEDAELTDDNMLMERIGIRPVCVDTGPENRKITTPDDVGIAEWILKGRSESEDQQ